MPDYAGRALLSAAAHLKNKIKRLSGRAIKTKSEVIKNDLNRVLILASTVVLVCGFPAFFPRKNRLKPTDHVDTARRSLESL